MDRHGAWAKAIALLVLWQAPSLIAAPPAKSEQAEQSTAQPQSQSWFQRTFGVGRKPQPTARASAGFAPNGRPLYVEVPKPPVKPKEAPAPMPEAPAGVDVEAKTLNQMQADFLRRMEVITKFKELALLNNDEAAMKRAEEMERQALEVYQQKTAHLPIARLRANESASPLDNPIGTGMAATPLNSPTQPRGEERPRTASIREVQR
ncbi:hypothetical protein [Tuwongella immobilis]|uniref:Uncharacterized protein n=1 Tax=Tuwongella immobilis TaxID=692036 RepID=A0A6C2YVE2_9BACT|nr:hypothetical protein [Tuwongella immobilis]VIP05414.1 unnamed protein product [Tuwongella immobilis]VTS08184.1 unnamed protein product [Tuwongella immobilis]